MRRTAKRWFRNVAGIVLILLGIVSGFLPILQGWLFIVLGLGMIDHPLKHRLHVWLGQRSRAYRRLALLYFRAKRRLRRKRRAGSAVQGDDENRTVDGA